MARATVKKDEGSAGRGGNPPRKPGAAKDGKGEPDSGRRKGTAVEETSAERYQNWLEEAKKYLNNVKAEAKRVTWPTKQEMKAFVSVVLFTLVLVTLYLFLCDTFFTKIFTGVIRLLHGASPTPMP